MLMHRRRVYGVIALFRWEATVPSLRKVVAEAPLLLPPLAAERDVTDRCIASCTISLHCTPVWTEAAAGSSAQVLNRRARHFRPTVAVRPPRAKTPDEVLAECPSNAIRIDTATSPTTSAPCIHEAARLAARKHERGRQGVRLDEPAVHELIRISSGCATKRQFHGIEGDKKQHGDELAEGGFARVELRGAAAAAVAIAHGVDGRPTAPVGHAQIRSECAVGGRCDSAGYPSWRVRRIRLGFEGGQEACLSGATVSSSCLSRSRPRKGKGGTGGRARDGDVGRSTVKVPPRLSVGEPHAPAARSPTDECNLWATSRGRLWSAPSGPMGAQS